MNGTDNGLPFEQFIQALTTQLDRAQRAMAIKAKNGNLPLTFAVKDLSLDLRTHVEMRGAAVYIRPAGPNETEASTIHLNLTTITRPMIEENAVALEEDAADPSIDEVLGDDVRPDEREELRRRLEWAGVHQVSQLRRLHEQRQERSLQRVTQLPLSRLRTAFSKVAVPRLSGVVKEQPPAPPLAPGAGPADARPVLPPLLRIQGDNLLRNTTPVVRLRGTPIPVLQASAREIVAVAPSGDLSGALSLEVEPGVILEADLGQTEAAAYQQLYGAAAPPRERFEP